MLGRTRRIHFVGIGGSGMNGIAELLANLGYGVTGSDVARSATTARLARVGITVHEGHDARFVGEADVVVVSSAIRRDNPEVAEAERRHIPVIPRAEMLGELMRLRFGIAVAGAHGKTTTTSMIALVLEHGGLDPTAVIGGRLHAFGGHARLGRGDCMVAEADESDRSFLKLAPAVAVITNVDREHLENYGSYEHLQQAFVEFANKVPFYGAIVACAEDPALAALLPLMTRRVITYGIEAPEVHYRASHVRFDGFRTECEVSGVPAETRGAARNTATHVPLGTLRLSVPGRHNVLNALAAVAVGQELGVRFEVIASALESFKGAERRFEHRGEVNGVLVVDDYGHHPSEIAAVLAAARTGLGRRVVVAFQPHRYTRTRQLLPEFGPALSGADEIVLTAIYPAGEAPIPGVTIDALAESVRACARGPVHVAADLADVPKTIARVARPGDVVITLGAGSIGGVVPQVLEELAREQPGS